MYKEVAIMWRNKESYVDEGGVFGLSIIKHVTLQKIVAHDFRYDPRIPEVTYLLLNLIFPVNSKTTHYRTCLCELFCFNVNNSLTNFVQAF